MRTICIVNSIEYNIDDLKNYLRQRMGNKRFTHSVNVASEAVKMAKHYGADTSKAYFAGLMHDVCKEYSPEEQKALVLKSNLDVEEAELNTRQLWHAIAGSVVVNEVFKVTDSDILRAIRFHTIGHADMTVFERIIYVGDMISAERSYDGVEKIRKLAYSNLDAVMFECVKYSMQKVINKGGFLPQYTFDAYNFYYKKNIRT